MSGLLSLTVCLQEFSAQVLLTFFSAMASPLALFPTNELNITFVHLSF